jgi:hypothetical protein
MKGGLMVTDRQVKGLFKTMSSGKTLQQSAARADMSENTARKYLRSGRLPSEQKREHDWRTRRDPFEGMWGRIEALLETSPALEAKTVFDWLCREYPGRFEEGQLRTLQRRFRQWRAEYGEAQEVFFPQVHQPGLLGASDFTHMNALGITIQGMAFNHLLYHFVLTWSNWEDATICFAESYESLHEGLQNALWRLGGCPRSHRTDCLTAAVNNLHDRKEFTDRYGALLRHYGMAAQRTNPDSGNENGDAEQAHRQLKRAIDQALMLRDSRDFASRPAYMSFLREVIEQQNLSRRGRIQEELSALRALPARRLPDYTVLRGVRVSPSSTIRVRKNTYSVHSRLIGYKVEVHLHAEKLEVYVGHRRVALLPRLSGTEGECINYRHIIDWLVRKPGAFAAYRYRSSLFPSSYFRMAYDHLCSWCRPSADREYLKILHYAACESESRVNEALRRLLDEGQLPRVKTVTALAQWLTGEHHTSPTVEIGMVDLAGYDELLNQQEVAG